MSQPAIADYFFDKYCIDTDTGSKNLSPGTQVENKCRKRYLWTDVGMSDTNTNENTNNKYKYQMKIMMKK